VGQHPEAPGGELDFVDNNFVDNVKSEVVANQKNSLLK
jgi:hypothetical protein